MDSDSAERLPAYAKPLSRRNFLAALAGAGLSLDSSGGSRAESVCRDRGRLSASYRSQEQTPLGKIDPRLLWGTHVEGVAIYDKRFVEALAKEQPRVLAVSKMKFNDLHPLSMAFEGEWRGKSYETWNEVDESFRLAFQIGARVRGDALIWNEGPPSPWVVALAAKRPQGWRDQLHAAFDKYFETLFTHVDALDRQYGAPMMRWCGVVNEPFEPWALEAGKSGWRTGPWLDAFEPASDGVPGYIHQAFECAARYSRASRPALFLNEASCDSDRFGPFMRKALLALVDNLQRRGHKLDSVGLQSHLAPQWMSDPKNPDWRPFRQFLKELSQRGLAIYITELDVNDCGFKDMAERDRIVADYTRSFATAALEQPAVTMITNWDFSDNYSWLRDASAPNAAFPTLGRWADCVADYACPRPTLYDENLAPKPARDALAKALRSRGW